MTKDIIRQIQFIWLLVLEGEVTMMDEDDKKQQSRKWTDHIFNSRHKVGRSNRNGVKATNSQSLSP